MRRTQLYLDEQLWNVLHTRARSRKTTVSELVREAVRERYFGKQDEQARAMAEFVGIRKDHQGLPSTEKLVRELRKGSRLERLSFSKT